MKNFAAILHVLSDAEMPENDALMARKRIDSGGAIPIMPCFGLG